MPVTSSHALGITVRAAGGSSSAKSQALRPARGPCSGTEAPPGTGTLSFSPAAPQHPALCRAQRPQVFGKRLEPVRFAFVQTFLKSLPGRPGITQAVVTRSEEEEAALNFKLVQPRPRVCILPRTPSVWALLGSLCLLFLWRVC